MWQPKVTHDSTLRIIPTSSFRRKLFDEVNGGTAQRPEVYRRRTGRDVNNWSQACLTCATYHVGRKVCPQLTPLPVSGGTFDQVGIDALEQPKARRGNWYSVVFVTKWPEVFDQTSATIAKLLVEEVISHHGVPSVQPSQAILSAPMKEVELLLGYRKLNTTPVK